MLVRTLPWLDDSWLCSKEIREDSVSHDKTDVRLHTVYVRLRVRAVAGRITECPIPSGVGRVGKARINRMELVREQRIVHCLPRAVRHSDRDLGQLNNLRWWDYVSRPIPVRTPQALRSALIRVLVDRVGSGNFDSLLIEKLLEDYAVGAMPCREQYVAVRAVAAPTTVETL